MKQYTNYIGQVERKLITIVPYRKILEAKNWMNPKISMLFTGQLSYINRKKLLQK